MGRLKRGKASTVKNLKLANVKNPRHKHVKKPQENEEQQATDPSTNPTPASNEEQVYIESNASHPTPDIEEQHLTPKAVSVQEAPKVCRPGKYNNANITPRSKSRIRHQQPSANPAGRRILTISAIESALKWAAKHGSTCSNPDLKITRERRIGLESSMSVECRSCHRPPEWLFNDIGEKSLPGNEAVAWAANTGGVGFTGLEHIFTVLDIPFLSFNTFSKQEIQFAKLLDLTLAKQLEDNGKEEARLAKANNQLIQTPSGEVPWTSVICDGQWSKRCYNQQGTALSGSAAIIGMLTKKPLFVAVRSKYCLVCHMSAKKSIQKPDHVCFKNFEGSSSAMEASIIEEGFRISVQQHGLIYRTLIGDGDSSVLLTVQNVYNKLEYGHAIVNKVECKNHAVRRLNYNLHQLTLNKMYSREDRSALALRMPTIGRCCKYAIEIRSETSDAQALRRDLMNILDHAFGDHSSCSTALCLNGIQVVPERYRHADFQLPCDQIGERHKNVAPVLREKPIWKSAKEIVERLASLSNSLIHNITSNIVESFQSSICKMIQGKRTNLVLRGGYTRRVHAAAQSFVGGSGWYANTYKISQGRSPVSLWRKRWDDGKRAKLASQKRTKHRKPKRALVRDKPTCEYFSRSRAALGNRHYGAHASRPDIPEEDLQVVIQELETGLQISSVEEQERIARETIGQFDNERYRERRRQMITASISGRIHSLRDYTANTGILDVILGVPVNAAAIRWGRLHEIDGITLYARSRGCEVLPSGLFISLENGVLGASPDGLVGADGILEVKCPFSARFCRNMEDIIKQCSFLTQSKNGKIELKRSHNYFSQVVMQLSITRRQWCELVVWTQGPMSVADQNIPVCREGHILVTRVHRSEETDQRWQLLLPKLLKFWRFDFAPELKDSRFDRNMGYRQPEYRLQAIQTHEKKPTKRKEPTTEDPNRKQSPVPTARRRLTFEDPDKIQDTIDSVIQKAQEYQRQQQSHGQPSSSASTQFGFMPPPTVYNSDSE